VFANHVRSLDAQHPDIEQRVMLAEDNTDLETADPDPASLVRSNDAHPPDIDQGALLAGDNTDPGNGDPDFVSPVH
jgi:hypothetical protein